MAGVQAFLQDRHALNLISIVVGIFAGLYGFYELLGRPGGILRQLLVALPSGVLAGGSLLVADNLTHQYYSHTLQSLTQFTVTPATLALIGFFPSFLIPIGAPSALRFTASGKARMPSWFETVMYALIIGISGMVSYIITLEAILAKINPFHWRPATLVVVILGMFSSLSAAVVGAWGMRQNAQRGQESDADGFDATRIAGCVVIAALYLVVLVVGALGLIALIELFSWSFVLYFVVAVLGVLPILGVQYLVDRLSRQQLGYLALILFGIAAFIQLYLALIS